MWFCPLDFTDGENIRPGSLAGLMEARFNAYCADMRERFFDAHFQKFDRQIVLVDVLGALHAGRDAFEDTRLAIQEISKSLRYGSPIMRMFRGGIDRVLFAATKADHVPGNQRDALCSLLGEIAAGTSSEMKSRGAKVSVAALASVRCTQDDVAKIEGRAVKVVSGVPMGRDRAVKFFPGEVPMKPPGADFWSDDFFELPVFQPPVLKAEGEVGIPHLGLDEVLWTLLGDRL